LRKIRELVREVLKDLSRTFGKLDASKNLANSRRF
jgi:hypothetical protein